MKHDYGKPEHGYSYEHCNFFEALLHMGHDILYFDFMTLLRNHDRRWMNHRLVEVARAEKPDLMFAVLFTDEFFRQTIREISENTGTITINWFCDDHWRFDNYSRHWAPCFNWVVTTAQSALPKYERLAYQNVIKSQWACNHYMYRRMDLPLAHDVTFVGQPHGNRRALIHALGAAGIEVRAWGSGWDSGRITQEEMIRVFNQSRINLNLSGASVSTTTLPARLAYAASSRVSGLLEHTPCGSSFKEAAKRIPAAVSRSRLPFRLLPGQEVNMKQYLDQIKGRSFEIPGCGGFMLTGHAEDLDRYYAIGEEIVCFQDLDDLVQKIRHYLNHDDERKEIAHAGHERTLREHTYAHRFTEIFQRLQLPCHAISDGTPSPGQVEEVD